MKIKLFDRILSALLALILLCGAAGIVAQLFFNVPIVEKVNSVFQNPDSLLKKAILIAAFVILFILALYCLSVLFRHKKKNSRFLTQTTEGGELDISLEALNNLVGKCIEQHPEVTTEKIILDNEKNCLSVKIIGNVAGGISIPLTVSQLQKQIKQYVTACSGVEVKEVRVIVRSSGEDAKDAPFAIEAPAMVPRLKASENENTETNEPVADSSEKPVTAPPAAMNVKDVNQSGPAYPPVENDDEPDNDDRPLHQRIFSQPEEMCFVPGPEAMKETAPHEEISSETESVVDDASAEEKQISSENSETETSEENIN